MKTFNILLSGAVTAAIASAASTTHATSISTYGVNQSAGLNVNVYISGSAAIDNTLNSVLNTASLNICQSGTVNKYQDNGNVLDVSGNPIGGASETLWYCQAGSASGISTNMFLAIFKESTAGSINGVQPLIMVATGGSSGLTFLNPKGPDAQNGTCAGNAQGTANAGCSASDFSQNVVATGGFSDMEAALLRTIPGGGATSRSATNTYLVNTPALDVVWGVAVTKNVYYALQSGEGQASRCPSANGVRNLDSPTCAPSLSRGQVAGLLDRDIYQWTALGLSNSSGDNTVYICREGAGSGNVATFEASVLGARCGASSESMAVQDNSTVIESASTNGVLQCMRAFDQGGIQLTRYNSDFGTTYPPVTPAGNQWAIGIASTEITTSQLSVYGDTLRMVAVDGVLPTLENVVNGFDPFWTTGIWYKVKPGYIGAPTGAPLAVFNAIQRAIGQPSAIAAADASYVNVWGDGGDLAIASLFATNTSYPSYPVGNNVVSNPVNLWTRASSGAVNNCDTPALWKGASGLISPTETLLGSGNINLGP